MKTKKQNPNEWCKGLYLSAGKYKDYVLKEDTPVSFISTAIVKLKGLPLTIRRELLSDKEKRIKGKNRRIDFIVTEEQFKFLKQKALKMNQTVSDTLRYLIFYYEMEDYSCSEESMVESLKELYKNLPEEEKSRKVLSFINEVNKNEKKR